MSSAAEVQERLRAADCSLVAIHFVDTAGFSRVKVIPLRRLESVARSGTGWSDIWAVVTIDEHYAEVPPYDSPSGDARLLPDASRARALPYLPGYAWAPVDQFSQELEPLPTCPRHVLRLAEERLTGLGLTARATYEVEMTLLRDGEPATPGPGYSVRSLMAVRDFGRELANALEAVDVPVEQFHPEYSPGQFEVSIAPSSPLEAADRLLLLRFTTRAVAAAHGMDVSFAPVVFPGGLGNGSHLHLSLWRGDRNLMTGGDGPAAMCTEGASFVAGIRDELPALMAVVAPSVPSYVRLQPGHWSGAYTAWGVENREASLRFVPGTVTSRSRSANVELKVVDGAANPYYALAACLHAGRAGVERGATLPDPTQEDPGVLDAETLVARGVRRLPVDLGEAAEAFAASDVLRDGLGTTMHDVITGVRRKEWADLGDRSEEELVELHRFAY
jgi:glutamine synthetase